MSTRREREEKERKAYRENLNNTVDAIISAGERAGKTYTVYDRMRLLAFYDERNIHDLGVELDRIEELEHKENEKPIE